MVQVPTLERSNVQRNVTYVTCQAHDSGVLLLLIIILNKVDMNPTSQLQTAIHAQGLRATRQRQLVLDVLKDNPGHLDAEAIHDQVKIRDSRISLATVYRTLALLKRLGLVAEHSLGEDHGHFEAARTAPHYHFTCLQCKRVIEFEAPAVKDIVQKLAAQEGLQVTETHLTLSGYCHNCQPTPEGE
jgi:Fe2+ or Zn2+ uptake regulation protein